MSRYRADSGRDKMRMNVGGDRLSSLPDDLIHKILSFRAITDAIGASVLSSRWRFIWTTMPYLNFSSEDFSTLRKFSKFVTHVLSHRNNLTEVYSVKLKFHGKAGQVVVKRILNYAFSHNVQKLDVVCLFKNDMKCPLSLFSSQSLKHLSLKHLSLEMPNFQGRYGFNRCLTSPWELPSLTTLNLHSVTLCDDQFDKCIDIFSKCANLKSLTLTDFETMGCNAFNIFLPRLSNLTLVYCRFVKVVNVVAPLLKNLTIRAESCWAKHVISAPHLASLHYEHFYYPLNLSTDGFHSLEKADICVSYPHEIDAHQIVCMLQHLHTVKFLTLNLEIVEVLSSSVELLLPQPSPFVNLKSLKIYPKRVHLGEQAPRKVSMSTEVKNYLLDGSPTATFTMVFREEIIAPKLMAELSVLLKIEKDSFKTNMAQIKSYWDNLGVQIELRRNQACQIISMLENIEEQLTKLPASNRAKIQPCFSSLCAEANIVISKIADCMKIQCDESQSRSNVCLHELATMSEPFC